MAENSFRRFYRREEFLALAPESEINVAVLGTVLGALSLGAPVAEVRAAEPPGDGVVVEWTTLPTSGADFGFVDAAVAAFEGGETTGQPFVQVSAAATTTTSGTPVNKIDFETPPLDAGTYQVIFSCQFRMLAVVAGEAARALSVITASPAGPATQMDHWGEAVVKAYNGAATIIRTAGQTIRVQLQIAEVGPGAGTAEISLARVTIDKIG